VDKDRYLEAIGADSRRLADAVRGRLEVPVPSCPEWTTWKLVRHLGGAHSWVKGMVRERAMSSGDEEGLPDGADIVDWFLEGSRGLVEVLDEADPSAEVWTWYTPDQTARFWQRRMAHETSIHRWDGEAAVRDPAPIGPELAVDGVDEWLNVVLPLAGMDPWLEGTIHVHATDSDGEWLIGPAEDGVSITRGHEKADAAVRGAASDLQLVMMHRKDPSSIEILGDEALAETFLTRMSF
jgi:uncharacterized protein (TIGR03083 family)